MSIFRFWNLIHSLQKVLIKNLKGNILNFWKTVKFLFMQKPVFQEKGEFYLYYKNAFLKIAYYIWIDSVELGNWGHCSQNLFFMQ